MWPLRPTRDKSTGKQSPVFTRSVRLGPYGEKLAARHLKRAGLKILARNYRCPAGEADIIALEKTTAPDETIVFVEVKTRSCDKYTVPESAVDFAKQQKLRGIAEYYLATHKTGSRAVRFDVVSLVIPLGGEPSIRHIPDAF